MFGHFKFLITSVISVYSVVNCISGDRPRRCLYRVIFHVAELVGLAELGGVEGAAGFGLDEAKAGFQFAEF